MPLPASFPLTRTQCPCIARTGSLHGVLLHFGFGFRIYQNFISVCHCIVFWLLRRIQTAETSVGNVIRTRAILFCSINSRSAKSVRNTPVRRWRHLFASKKSINKALFAFFVIFTRTPVTHCCGFSFNTAATVPRTFAPSLPVPARDSQASAQRCGCLQGKNLL